MPISAKKAKEIDKALDIYRRKLAKLLLSAVTTAYIKGDTNAQEMLGISISMDLVQKEALEFLVPYGDMLVNEGATIIKGEKIYWLNDHTNRTRQKVLDVITKGIEEGKPVAEIGGKKIAPGTIAEDLQNLLIRDKDYEYVRIARTETGRVQNIGTLNRFGKHDVEEVTVLDDEGPASCEACKLANGQVWSLEKASINELEHPNCVRAFSPIIKRTGAD